MINSKIFKREEVLFPEYLPPLLPHREEQIKHLANNLLPIAKGRRPQNTFIFGPPGTGKTAVTRFVFRQFEEYSERIKTIYINCWDYKTSHAILTKLVLECGVFTPRRGIGKDEVLEKFLEICRKTEKGFILGLDEVDQLVLRDPSALYDLLRINQYVKNPIGIIFISNDKDVFVNLDDRIRSSMSIEEMEFKPYSIQEMKDILKERVKEAFFKVESGVILLAAAHAVKKGGDVRVGLECLLKAGRLAEKENASKLLVSHLKKVLREVNEVKPKILEERVDETERMILEILGDEKMTSGKLYEIYKGKVENPITLRAFREKVNHLISIGLVRAKVRKEGRGITRILWRI